MNKVPTPTVPEMYNLGDCVMIKPSLSLLSAVLLSAVFTLGVIGTATAGDSCGGKGKGSKNEKDDTALVVTPEMPGA